MERKSIILINQHLQDLNPLTAGYHACRSGHSFGPAVRRYTLIHYVLRGKGTFYTRGGAYPVEAGQAFLILPGEITTYTADADDPWVYEWMGFDGTLSAHFAQLPPVFPVARNTFDRLIRRGDGSSMQEYQMAAALFQLYCELFSQRSQSSDHVRRVQSYIQTCFVQHLSVEKIATQINLDRRYLSRIFKQKTGYTIQDYIIQVRLEEAARCLEQGCSVQEAARLSGYEDASNFSKMFKKRYGKSPTQWRKQ